MYMFGLPDCDKLLMNCKISHGNLDVQIRVIVTIKGLNIGYLFKYLSQV